MGGITRTENFANNDKDTIEESTLYFQFAF
jgi:hypothetical protein